MPPVGFRIPAWADPANASVFDSGLTRAARTIGQFLGVNDPQSQIMAVAAPIEVPGGRTMGAIHGLPDDLEGLSRQILQESDGKLSVLDLRRKPSGDVELETIATAPGQQGQGAGTAAMQKLTKWADAKGVRLILSPSNKGYQPVARGAKTTSTARLVDFYRRFGFVDPTSARFYDPTISSPTRPVLYRPPQGGQ